MEKQCPCGKIIEVKPSVFERKKYCSKKCFYRFKKRPRGLKYKLTKVNSGWFKKGFTPWIKGKKLSEDVKNKISIANKGRRFSPNTEFKKGQFLREKHPFWKGDNVGYYALHVWVKKELGKAKKCEECKSELNVQWANKSRKYLRNINDWFQLCIKCHNKYDKGHWGAMKRKWSKYAF